MNRMINILAAFVLLTGCATVINGVNQAISLTTTPSGATCNLTNSKGIYKLASTPGTVVVKRSASSLLIECQKKGFEITKIRIDGKTIVLTGGNIGMFTTFIDLADGASFSYPSPINVNMLPIEKPKNKPLKSKSKN
ncbi:MAG: hypothetical protein AB7F64_05470 [Gammaproteobacteria bacterium]